MSRVQKNKTTKRKKGATNKKQRKSLLKKVFQFCFLFLGLLLLSGAGLFAYYASSSPELTEKDLLGSFSSELLDEKGNVFYVLGNENRDFVDSKEIPEVLKEAVTSIEDQRFYKHFGIDPIRLGGAVLANFKRGFGAEGGSTITQQLVKLSVFSTKQEDQTLKRKAQEAWLSIQLERKLSKDQILTLYINKVYLSENIYGMGTASEYYFGKPINELSLNEAALLAGMPQAPNAYNPYTNPERAKKRRDRVLAMMVDNKKLSQNDADKAMEIPISEGLVEQQAEKNNLVFDAYLKQVLKEIETKTGLDPYTAGLTVHTNLDMPAQQRLYDILNSDEYIQFPDDQIQAGVSVVDVKNGQVKALGGGRKSEYQLGTNRASEQKRDIGSTMKPLSVYGPAIEFLKYSTYQQVVDEPYTYPGTKWTPGNYDGKFKGQMSIRDALIDSRNIPAAKTLNEVGLEKSEEFLKQIGIENLNKEGLLPANAISGYVTPMQLSSSYASFANGGTYTDPFTVSKITMQNGQEVDLTPASSKAMSEATAFMVTDILKDVASAYASTVGVPGVPQAGKTGTSNYSKEEKQKHNIPSDGVPDSWYSGYTTDYSVSVWVGYDMKFNENSWLSTGKGTRQLPRIIYQRLMSFLAENAENADWSRPGDVVEVAVEKGSNPAKLPGPNTPENAIVKELFIKGTEPSEESDRYGKELEAVTGLQAAYDESDDELEIQWDEYEFEEEGPEDVTYLLKINGESFTVKEEQFKLKTPPEGEITISVSVQAYNTTGPESSIKITINKQTEEQEEEEEENNEEDASDTSEDTSSEEESSSNSEEENKTEEKQDEEQDEEDEENNN